VHWEKKKFKVFCSVFFVIVIFFSAGCFYRLNLQRVHPLTVDLRDYQPIAILPIPDAPAYPKSGLSIFFSAQDFLLQRGYTLIDPAVFASVLEELRLPPQALLSDAASISKLNERLQAKLLLVGTILEYRKQKSYLSARDFQVWEGALYEYRTLPTYHQGTCQMRLLLRMLNLEKGSLVWMAEGRISGPSSAAEMLEKKLVERLLENLLLKLNKP